MHQGLKLESPICFLLSIAELLKAKGDGSRFTCLACPLVWWHVGWDSPNVLHSAAVHFTWQTFKLCIHYRLYPYSPWKPGVPHTWAGHVWKLNTRNHRSTMLTGTDEALKSKQKSVQGRIPPSRLKTCVLNITALQEVTETGTAELVPFYLTAVLGE